MVQITGYGLLALLLLGTPSRGQEGVRVIQKPDAKKADEFLFDVQPRIITAGEPATLRWSIKGATKVMLEEASGSGRELRKMGTFGGSGSVQIHPKEDTTYVISCEGSTTFSCASITVRVRVKPH
jgi:hypothetical protein